MRVSRRSFLAESVVLAASAAVSAESADTAGQAVADALGIAENGRHTVNLPEIALRGYGTISVRHVAGGLPGDDVSVTTIACAKALLVQAKYLSDLLLLPGADAVEVSVGTVKIPAVRSPSGGAVACYAHGADAMIFAASRAESLPRIVAAANLAKFSASDFRARVNVPAYLDRFDKYGLLIYYGPFDTPPGTQWRAPHDFLADMKWVADNGLGLVVWSNPLPGDTGEGMTTQAHWSWVEDAMAALNCPLHVNTSIAYPLNWLANRYPYETMLKAPQFMGGYYGIAHDSSGQGAISWHSGAAKDVLLGDMQQTVRNYVGASNVVGWLEPHAETSEEPQSLFLDSGPMADRSMQDFLRTRYATLSAVSERWHGNASHYRSWHEITLPEVAQFLGFSGDAVDLRGVWKVKYAPSTPASSQDIPPQWLAPDFDDSGWDEFTAPGNDRALTLARQRLVYRRTVDIPPSWPESHPKSWIYVWTLIGDVNDDIGVTVNGKEAPRVRPNSPGGVWGLFDTTGLIAAGPNTIVLDIPRAQICYRVYLTGSAPAEYPNLGRHENARWVDFVRWTMLGRADHVRRGTESVRQIDPNRPINLMATDENLGAIKTVSRDYGAHFHCTGYSAGFWADYHPLVMRSLGLPSTAEAGNGAPDATQFQAFLGRFLSEGLNGIHYFMTLGEILWRPDVLAEFEKNRVMYETIGKYHVPKADVAVLFGVFSERLTRFPWDQRGPSWIPGGYFRYRPDLLAFCCHDGVTEEDFLDGNASRYKIIVDANTPFMDGDLLDGIESFVRAGGVFVTNGQTGRHTEVLSDAWPISRLTGYRVLRANTAGGQSLQPAPGQAVLPSDPWLSGNVHADGASLAPVASDVHNLLLWADGTVAVGMRPLGYGWIFHVGPLVGPPLLTQILAHFGVERVQATCDTRGVYCRHYIGNTGLHDIYVLYNDTPSPTSTKMTFRADIHPARLIDRVTGDALSIVRDPAGDTVPSIPLAPFQTRMYVAPRPNSAQSPLEWISLQRGWWSGAVSPPGKLLPSPRQMQWNTLDLSTGWFVKEVNSVTDDQAAELAQVGVDTSGWERRDMAIWKASGQETSRIVMRKSFTVPASWTKGRTFLCCNVPGGIFYDGARVFVDGKPVSDRRTWDGPGFDPVGGALIPGKSHLLAFDIVSAQTLIGACGPAYVAYLPDPLAAQGLAGQWSLFTDAIHSAGQVTLPGKATGMYVSRTVVIDKERAAHHVAVTMDGDGIQGILVNGRFLNGTLLINITPMVKFGEENQIELMLRGNADIRAVALHYYEPGECP